ncbi:MAG: diguanylate cyclase protein/HDIG protein [Thermoleophilia bacterium]|nr:diguanylate cyclase protein/HDIG protein [Thermoleophilia bacterium]
MFTVALSVGFALQLVAWRIVVRRARLTGLERDAARDRRAAPSRAAFDRLADQELARAQRLGHDLSIAVFDTDALGECNDVHGYASGDLLISATRRVLVEEARRIDTIVSLGGGAWAMLLPDLSREDAGRTVEALRAAVHGRVAEELVVALGIDHAQVPTLSAGAATSAAGSISAKDLMQASDQACLAAKAQGGDRSCGWSTEARDIVRRAAGRRRQQRDSELATVLSLAEALDLRDADTSNHSRQVGRYAELMAQGLGLAPAHVERVRVAGLLHDIGKIGVPDSVLRKPGKLDEDEWAQMQAHPEIGARLLASIDAEDIRSWVIAHHERPDGRGYPHGLSNADIPLEAKILSVADAYEAMTADRVYRAAPGPVIARAELDKWRGAQFDGEVVDVFLQVLDELEPLPAPGEETGATVTQLRPVQPPASDSGDAQEAEAA